MKKILTLSLALCLSIGMLGTLPASAAGEASDKYTKVAKIYDAEDQLWSETGGSMTGLTSGTQVLNRAGQDDKDKKEGNYSLWQSVRKGEIAWWHCGDEKYKDKGNQIDVSGTANLGFQMWLYVSDASVIGGDDNYDKTGGTINIDFGSGSTGGYVQDQRIAFWVDANSLSNGWNLITLQVPRTKDTAQYEKKYFDANGIRYTVDASNNNVDFTNINWIRVMTTAKKEVTFKYDDVKFVDLGSDSFPSYSTEETTPPAPTEDTSSKDDNSTPAPDNSSDADQSNTEESSTTPADSSSKDTDSTSTGSKNDSSTTDPDNQNVNTPKKSNTGLIVGLIVACVVVLGGGGAAAYFLVFKKKKTE